MSVPCSNLSWSTATFPRRSSQEASIVSQQQKRLRKKSDRDRGRRQKGGTSSEDEGVSGVLLWQKYWKNRPKFGEAQNDHDMSDDLYDMSPVRKQDVIMNEHEDKKKNCKNDESDGTGYISDEEDDRSVEVKRVDVPMEENNRRDELRNDMRMEVDSD